METLFGDSQLVIRQMTGEYKCNKMTTNSKKERSKNNIYPLYEEAIVLVKDIERFGVGGGEDAVTFKHVYCDQNSKAVSDFGNACERTTFKSQN